MVMRLPALMFLVSLLVLHLPSPDVKKNIEMQMLPYAFVYSRITETTAPLITTNTTTDTSNDFSLWHGNSLTESDINRILAEYNSPAQNTGASFVQAGIDTGIDNAYVLYIFIHESTAGSNPNWAGWKSDGTTTHNIGNIICTPDWKGACYGRFRDYPNWHEGITASFYLLKYYRDVLKHKTIDEAIYTWAPPIENDTELYVNSLKKTVATWRAIQVPRNDTETHVVVDPEVITAGFYTVNCAYWAFQSGCQHFGTDFAADKGTPVYAPFGCNFITTGYYPANTPQQGYYWMCKKDDIELYLGHLNNVVTFAPGAYVRAGTQIGEIWLNHTHVQAKRNGQLIDVMSLR